MLLNSNQPELDLTLSKRTQYFITVYDKRLASTEHKFGEIKNVISGSSGNGFRVGFPK